jgi:hypothetical protein
MEKVNGRSSRRFSRQNARFSAFSPGNLRFEKPVKYKIAPPVNQKMQSAGAQNRSPLNALARRYSLGSAHLALGREQAGKCNKPGFLRD